jgi:hypothetical protein
MALSNCVSPESKTSLEAVVQGNPKLAILISRITCCIKAMYTETQGLYPGDLSFWEFSREELPKEYFDTVIASLDASPTLYRASIENDYISNERDYFTKYPLTLLYINNALAENIENTKAINISIFEAVKDFVDVWPFSEGGWLERTSDRIFRDNHFLIDGVDALPDEKDFVDAKLENSLLTKAISFLNSLALKLQDNGLGSDEESKKALLRSNFALLANGMRDTLTTELSNEIAGETAVLETPDGETVEIDREGKIVESTKSSGVSTPKDKKSPSPKKSVDYKKAAIWTTVVIGGASLLYFGYKSINQDK